MKIWACFFSKKAEEKISVEVKNFLNVEELEEVNVQPVSEEAEELRVPVSDRQYVFYSHLENEIEGEARFNKGIRNEN